MPKALLIVDPQHDFIDGALPVPGAPEAMTNLARHIAANPYALKIITCDFHPYNHCSFQNLGGQWPAHCIAHSLGASIHPDILTACHTAPNPTHILPKGESASREEYSIWQNPCQARKLSGLLAASNIDAIDICGIAGDICVLNTLADGLKKLPGTLFQVLGDFTPSLDGGVKLAGLCQKEGICIR